MTLHVDASGYDSAAAALYDGNRRAGAAYELLTGALSGSGAMAGDDVTSTAFATEYDDSAGEALAAYADLVSSYSSLAELAAASGGNHRAANAHSVYRQPIPAVSQDDAARRAVEVSAYTPPSALGGDDPDLPELWNLVADYLEGYTWPGADTGRLRDTGSAWRDAADSIDRLSAFTSAAEGELTAQRSPEIRDALDTLDELDTTGADLAACFRDLGEACDDFAEQVETTREVVRGLLRDLAIEVGVTVAAGAIGSVFTFGGAAGGTVVAIGLRAAAYARKIVDALRALKLAAKLRAVATLQRAGTTIRRLRTKLAKWAKSKPRDERGQAKLPGGGPKKVTFSTAAKIEKQMVKRGWTRKSMQELIDDPDKIVETRDTRWLPDGSRMDDPATAYIDDNGAYVVRNDRTGDIVQVSDRNNPNWKSPW